MTDTDTITAEIIALADEAYRCFKRGERDNGDKYVYAPDAPQWVTDLCLAAHDAGGMFPDDWRYEFIHSALGAITDAGENADAGDTCWEFGEPDVYTSELTSWLSSRNDRYAYCDEAAAEGLAEDADLIARISAGQSAEKREVFYSVVQSLAERAEELADAEESDNDEQA